MAEGPGEAIPGYSGLAVIGQGGSGVVYRARQEAFDRDVAVKVLRGDFDESTARRFLREVRLTGRLTGHPNVVTALDAGTTPTGHPYLVMDLYERGSLQDRLSASGPIPAPEVAAIGAKIAGALADAHALGMVHRDVKPNNILVSRFGEPALADFGVAVVPDTLSAVTMVNAFTPHHAAPEILSGTGAQPASDVYSLGSTLYQLLTGRPPFHGEDGGNDIAALLYRIVNNPAPPLITPDLPGLAAVVMRALEKDPAARPESAAAMAAELRLLSGGAERLSGSAISLSATNSGAPTHPAQGEGAGPGFAGPPGTDYPTGQVVAGGFAVGSGGGLGGQQGPAGGADKPEEAPPWMTSPGVGQPQRTTTPRPAPPMGPGPADEATVAVDFDSRRAERTLEERTGNRRPLIIGASAVAAVAVAVAAIALSQGSSGTAKSPSAQRVGSDISSSSGATSDLPTGSSSSRPGGQPVSAGGAPGSSSTSGANSQKPGGTTADQPGAPVTSAPGTTSQSPYGGPTGVTSAPAPTSNPPSSTTSKPTPPPTTSTTSKNTSCTGWRTTHQVNNDGIGYAAGTGSWNMRSGPYAVCPIVGQIAAGEKLWIWCHTTNADGHTWVYGRPDSWSGGNAAWQSVDNLKPGWTPGPAC